MQYNVLKQHLAVIEPSFKIFGLGGEIFIGIPRWLLFK